jgi:hypothetical protein
MFIGIALPQLVHHVLYRNVISTGLTTFSGKLLYSLVHHPSLKRPYLCKPSRWLSIAWVHLSHGQRTYLHWSTTLFIEMAWLVLLNMMEIFKIRTICWARRRNFLYLWKNIILLCWVRYLQIFVQFVLMFLSLCKRFVGKFSNCFYSQKQICETWQI